MCDTMVVSSDDGLGRPVWFAKNSDREAGEAQLVEHLPRASAEGVSVRATWITVPEAGPRCEVVLSRPSWMWGAEMGVNEHGVAIGNEAVFTKLPVADSGLTGMDLLRIALERSSTADDALDRITGLIARYGQGGPCGYRNKGFRYHNAFLIADSRGAWLLETADRYWAASRVRGVGTSSNVLTLDRPADILGRGTLDEARRRGLWSGTAPFSFREAFGRKIMGILSGGDVRRAFTARSLAKDDGGVGCGLDRVADTVRSHGPSAHGAPGDGLRMESPCAHASFLPTRTAGQTTGSMIACLGPEGPVVWTTATSSPCLSILKRVPLGKGELVQTGATHPSSGTDATNRDTLWWRHERLHRAVMIRGYARSRVVFEAERASLEREAWAIPDDPRVASELFARHGEKVTEWARAVELLKMPPSGLRGIRGAANRYFWKRESVRDGL